MLPCNNINIRYKNAIKLATPMFNILCENKKANVHRAANSPIARFSNRFFILSTLSPLETFPHPTLQGCITIFI